MDKDKAGVEDPFQLFQKWYQEAQTGISGQGFRHRVFSAGFARFRKALSSVFPWANLFRPDIATLATITPAHRPAARSILFKGMVEGGFSFFTDYESEKGRELAANPHAVMVFYWHLPPRQVRIDGPVFRLSRHAAVRDWKLRKRDNQAASAALRQSSRIQGRKEYLKKTNDMKHRYKGRSIPCPDSWGGYILMPETMEFWEGRLDWLHQREKYFLENGSWRKVTLAP